MSKSKRPAQAMTTPAPQSRNHPFKNPEGGVRAGWLLALSLLAYIGLSAAVRAGLLAVFGALFSAWGIDGQSVSRAPRWAQTLYAWHGSLVTAMGAVAALILCRFLKRLWSVTAQNRRFPVLTFGRAALAGLAMALLIAALCLLPDSMRPEWPLSRPRGDAALPALCLLSLLSAVPEEVFTRRVIQDGLRSRWGEGWAALCSAVSLLLIGAWPGSVPATVNTLLLGLACALLHARFGLWSAVGFRWAWSVANVFLLGFGGGSHAVYRLYGVSERALTGGEAGFIGGLWATLAFSALIAVLCRERIAEAIRIYKTRRR